MAHGEGDVTRRDSSGETPSPSNPVLSMFFEVTKREILGVKRRRTNDCWEYLRQIKGVNRYPDQWLVWKTASSITSRAPGQVCDLLVIPHSKTQPLIYVAYMQPLGGDI